jgi:hypothetical protein
MDSEVKTPELPLEETKEEAIETTPELSLELPKDVGEPTTEEVRVESVDVNTVTVTDKPKPKSPSYLEKKIETIKKIFLHYTSCSVKTTQQNNNQPK